LGTPLLNTAVRPECVGCLSRLSTSPSFLTPLCSQSAFASTPSQPLSLPAHLASLHFPPQLFLLVHDIRPLQSLTHHVPTLCWFTLQPPQWPTLPRPAQKSGSQITLSRRPANIPRPTVAELRSDAVSSTRSSSEQRVHSKLDTSCVVVRVIVLAPCFACADAVEQLKSKGGSTKW
jgi:hypothetical protein